MDRRDGTQLWFKGLGSATQTQSFLRPRAAAGREGLTRGLPCHADAVALRSLCRGPASGKSEPGRQGQGNMGMLEGSLCHGLGTSRCPPLEQVGVGGPFL